MPIPTTALWADLPATIGHNGGPVFETAPAPVPNLSPVEQSGKAIGAGSWTAVVGTIWTVLVSLDVLPATVNTPEVSSAVLTIGGAVSAAVGAYRARNKRFAAPRVVITAHGAKPVTGLSLGEFAGVLAAVGAILGDSLT